MKLLTDDDVRRWCGQRSFSGGPGRTLQPAGARYLEVILPEVCWRVIALGPPPMELLSEDGAGFPGAGHWVTDLGIWGHLFLPTEALDAQAFLTHSLLFGWDAYLIPTPGRAFFCTSHEEVIHLAGTGRGLLGACRRTPITPFDTPVLNAVEGLRAKGKVQGNQGQHRSC